jgi:2-polyprenyl-3-methyl-5-hydroxy-6-metoxy-1,4-benzoquinol methylase
VTAGQQHAQEIAAGQRFEFGANWSRFLSVVDETRIEEACQSLCAMLGLPDLAGKRFLDVGSGSGLFSLAARRLGAEVHSFDFDPKSVACTQELRRRYHVNDPHWIVAEGSVLDASQLARLGEFDVVYSWGVLHHTGAMWQALGNVAPLVAPRGRLFIAIYNDQGWTSRYWLKVKRAYVKHAALRWPLVLLHMPYPFLPSWLYQTLRHSSTRERGMSFWYDMIDWLGGYPFEVAKPEEIFRFFRDKGFHLREMKTTHRHGCNEFVFKQGSDVSEPVRAEGHMTLKVPNGA